MDTQEPGLVFIAGGIFLLVVRLFINPLRPATKNIQSGKGMRDAGLFGGIFFIIFGLILLIISR
jgi:hypothetical protein